MTLIKLYEVGDGAVISKYRTDTAPFMNEKIYVGEKIGIVKEVAHVVEPQNDAEEDSLAWIEVGIIFEV